MSAPPYLLSFWMATPVGWVKSSKPTRRRRGLRGLHPPYEVLSLCAHDLAGDNVAFRQRAVARGGGQPADRLMGLRVHNPNRPQIFRLGLDPEDFQRVADADAVVGADRDRHQARLGVGIQDDAFD